MIGYDLNIIEKGIRGIFGREFVTRQRKARYPDFCTIVNSDKKSETYNAISTLPQLSEMKDERVLAGFSEYTSTITNLVYATGIRVPRQIFDFDQTGQLRTLVHSLSARVANHPDKLTMALIGANGTCYDTGNFFSATHDLGNGESQLNLLAGDLTDALVGAVTKDNRDIAIAAFQMNFKTAKAMLLEMTDDRGEPWHDSAEPEGLTILCHPRAEFFVRTALEATIIADTGNAMLKQVNKIITTPYSTPFTYHGDWYLLKTDTPIQPFIFQRFGPKVDFPDAIPEADQEMLQALNAIEIQTVMRSGKDIDAHTFFDDEYLFGARAIYAVGYGMWQNAIKVSGS